MPSWKLSLATALLAIEITGLLYLIVRWYRFVLFINLAGVFVWGTVLLAWESSQVCKHLRCPFECLVSHW